MTHIKLICLQAFLSRYSRAVMKSLALVLLFPMYAQAVSLTSIGEFEVTGFPPTDDPEEFFVQLEERQSFNLPIMQDVNSLPVLSATISISVFRLLRTGELIFAYEFFGDEGRGVLDSYRLSGFENGGLLDVRTGINAPSTFFATANCCNIGGDATVTNFGDGEFAINGGAIGIPDIFVFTQATEYNAAGSIQFVPASDFNFDFSIGSISGAFTPVPLPAGIFMLLGGLVFFTRYINIRKTS